MVLGNMYMIIYICVSPVCVQQCKGDMVKWGTCKWYWCTLMVVLHFWYLWYYSML